jgi:hypothetical protein
MKIFNLAALALLGTAAAQTIGVTPGRCDDNWKSEAAAPVTNPLYFEDPAIATEIRPIFLYHDIDKSFVTGGGNVEVYAVQLRYAITDRLAVIATEDGYIDFHPKSVLTHQSGWADLAAGLKYALIDDKENTFILTPGFKLKLPTGNEDVFQGTGDGQWDIFVSSAKGLGYGFHLTGNVGFLIPNDFDKETAEAHYSLQLDYNVCRYFKPFISMNGFTVLDNANGPALPTEGFDLINFGSSAASGDTQIALGIGFRSHVLNHVDVGFAYEFCATHPEGLFGDRFTVDVSYRF